MNSRYLSSRLFFRLLFAPVFATMTASSFAQSNPSDWDVRGNWSFLFFAEDGTYGLTMDVQHEDIYTGVFSGTVVAAGYSGTVAGQITGDDLYLKTTTYYPVQFFDSFTSTGTLTGSCIFTTGSDWTGWDYSVSGHATHATPEPCSLIALGGGMCAFLRRRRNKLR